MPFLSSLLRNAENTTTGKSENESVATKMATITPQEAKQIASIEVYTNQKCKVQVGNHCQKRALHQHQVISGMSLAPFIIFWWI